MAIRATIRSGYRVKLALIGAMIGGFGLWAGYDAFVAYPPQREMYQAYLPLKNQGLQTEWPEYARQRGWSEEEPKKRSDGDINFNIAILGIMLPIGLYFLYNAATAGKRWTQLDDQNILSTHAGKKTPLSKVIDLNEKRWNDKGLAVVTYEDEKGSKQRIVLDDINYETQPMRQIFDRVKNTLHPQAETAAASHAEAAPLDATSAGEQSPDSNSSV